MYCGLVAHFAHLSRNYVDQATALAQNLSFASDTSFIMRADSFTVLDPNGPGRSAVRIKSNNAYSTHVTVYAQRSLDPLETSDTYLPLL